MTIDWDNRIPAAGLLLGALLLLTAGSASAMPRTSVVPGDGGWQAKGETSAEGPDAGCLACHKSGGTHLAPGIGPGMVGVANRLPRNGDGFPLRLTPSFLPVTPEVETRPLLTPEDLDHELGFFISLRY